MLGVAGPICGECELFERFHPSVYCPRFRATRRRVGYCVPARRLDGEGILVRPNLIETLGDDPSAAATNALQGLTRASDAEAWLPAIAGARESQARKRREREYRPSDIGHVVRTLDNEHPANAADLAALVFDELNDLCFKIRDGSTSDWRQYWNVDCYNRPIDPKPEDACWDAVLSDLQERLERLGIDAQWEGAYAEDNRSDIASASPVSTSWWRSSEAVTTTSGLLFEAN